MPRGIPNVKLKTLKEAAKAQATADAKLLAPALPPPAPEPPNPVVIALQEQILGLVNQRTSAQGDLFNANATLRNVQATAESARERLQQLEGEVRYRMGLINEMLGKPAQPAWTPDVYQPADSINVFPYSNALPGVGSIPPRRAPMAGVEGEVRSEGADDIRRSI